MTKDMNFETAMASLLKGARIPFKTEVAVGGLQPDFVIRSPEGRTILLDAKAWGNRPGLITHAVRQAEYFKNASRADAAYIVMKDLQQSQPSKGLLAFDDVIKVLTDEFNQPSASPPTKPIDLKAPKAIIFAAMPFAGEYEDTFWISIVGAAEKLGAASKRVDLENHLGNIMEKTEELIRSATVVIADFSESKPNVLYEAGFARGVGKMLIPICSTPIENLPFDVAQWNTIAYKKGQTHKLLGVLVNRLQSVLPP
jgi:hypothetical protein